MRRAAYRVSSPLDHDQREYAPGEVVDLDATAAEPLLAAGVIEALPTASLPEATDATDARTADGEGDDRTAALFAAISALEPGREDHWTTSGKPEVRALNAAPGLGNVTAAERDAAWAAYQDGSA